MRSPQREESTATTRPGAVGRMMVRGDGLSGSLRPRHPLLEGSPGVRRHCSRRVGWCSGVVRCESISRASPHSVRDPDDRGPRHRGSLHLTLLGTSVTPICRVSVLPRAHPSPSTRSSPLSFGFAWSSHRSARSHQCHRRLPSSGSPVHETFGPLGNSTIAERVSVFAREPSRLRDRP